MPGMFTGQAGGILRFGIMENTNRNKPDFEAFAGSDFSNENERLMVAAMAGGAVVMVLAILLVVTFVAVVWVT